MTQPTVQKLGERILPTVRNTLLSKFRGASLNSSNHCVPAAGAYGKPTPVRISAAYHLDSLRAELTNVTVR